MFFYLKSMELHLSLLLSPYILVLKKGVEYYEADS